MLNNVPTRKVITLMMTVVFCVMALMGRVDNQQFMTVFTVVVGFYYGKSTALEMPKERKDDHVG